MKLTIPAIAFALFTGAASAALAQPTPPKPPATPVPAQTVAPSAKAAKAIVELDAAVKANDRANIPAKLAAAEAVASTKNDKYLVASLRLKAAIAASDTSQMLAATDAIAAAGLQSPTEVAQIYDAVGNELYKNKLYPQAIAAFQKSLALNPSNSGTVLDLGEAQFAGGQAAGAVASFRKAIAASTASGQKPDEQLYKRALGIAYKAQLPDAVALGREWVAAYPSPDSWRNALGIFRNQTHQDAQGTIDLMRLMQATGALQQPEDYGIFIQATADQMNYNEAQKLYDAGVAAGTIDPSKPEFVEVRDVLKGKAKATPADLEAAIKMSPTPVNLLRIGDRFYAMGDYARAAQVYRDVLGKPGADRDLANLHLGMALARSGDKAAAMAALNAVTGPRAEIAKYWLLYSQQQS